MKKFFKRANRGLLLGGVILLVLIVYIIVDYSRFSSEKDTIKKQIESYMDSFLTCLEANDYEAVLKLVNDNWTGKAVMNNYYFYDISDITAAVKNAKEQASTENPKYIYDVSDADYRITSTSIKKAGPNMATVTLKYTITLSSNLSLDLILPFQEFYGYGDDDTTRYSCVFEGEYTLYMYKENGTWKFSQSSGYDSIYNMTAIEEVE